MKKFRIFGLAALATAGLLAMVALGTASATEMYQRTAGGITTLTAGTEIKSSLTGGSTSFTNTAGTVTLDTCTGGETKGTNSTAGSATTTVINIIHVFIFTGCTEPTETSTLGEVETHHISGTTNGTVTIRHWILIINTTIFEAKCEYTAGEALDVGTLVGASTSTGNATIEINTVLPAKNSFFCPDANWKANYKVTSPVGLVEEAS